MTLVDAVLGDCFVLDKFDLSSLVLLLIVINTGRVQKTPSPKAE